MYSCTGEQFYAPTQEVVRFSLVVVSSLTTVSSSLLGFKPGGTTTAFELKVLVKCDVMISGYCQRFRT